MDIMGLLEQINVRGTTILMVTHAKDIVDKMNKRVVAIDHGHIVRDEEGSYGYSQQNAEEDIYVPGFTQFIDKDEILAGVKEEIPEPQPAQTVSRRTVMLDPEDIEMESMIDSYLDGGDGLYG